MNLNDYRLGSYDVNAYKIYCFSVDDGKTWYGNLMLDAREQVSYPDGVEGEDGFSLFISAIPFYMIR